MNGTECKNRIIKELNLKRMSIKGAEIKTTTDSEGNIKKTIPDRYYVSIGISNTLRDTTDEMYLDVMYKAMFEVCSTHNPRNLIESVGSGAPMLKRLSDSTFLRKPNKPTMDANLDLDPASCEAVVLISCLRLVPTVFGEVESVVAGLLNEYNEEPDEDTFIPTYNPFFMYSEDEEEWHDNCSATDYYIKFKKEDGTWSESTRFKGDNGEDGKDAPDTFAGLSDTPDELEANKILGTNNDGTAIVLKDEVKSSQDFDSVTGDVEIDSDITRDFRYDGSSEAKATHYFLFTGDAKVNIDIYEKEEDDKYLCMELGRIYTFTFYPDGNNVELVIDSDAATLYGDVSIDSSKTLTTMQFTYDGMDIILLNKVSYD